MRKGRPATGGTALSNFTEWVLYLCTPMRISDKGKPQQFFAKVKIKSENQETIFKKVRSWFHPAPCLMAHGGFFLWDSYADGTAKQKAALNLPISRSLSHSWPRSL